jgi:type I restriction enzyme M protein
MTPMLRVRCCEYLLNKIASAGTNRQFRTPRHIIKTMVEITKPKPSDLILDPACGTAGFLIESYKYILKTNTSSEEKERGQFTGDKLTPAQHEFFRQNLSTVLIMMRK